MSDYSYIGKHIRKLRRSNNVTQKDLAIKIGKTESSIQKYEAGKVQIPIDVIEKIALELGVNKFTLMAMDFNDLKEQAEDEIKKDIENMLGTVGYQPYELESGDYELSKGDTHIIVSKKELDALYVDFLDYITYATDKFYKDKIKEKHGK